MSQIQGKCQLVGLTVLVAGLVASGCANTSIANPPPVADPFYTYRWLALGAGVLLSFIQVGMIGSVNEDAGAQIAGQIIGSLVGIPLQWTIIGEWIFRLLQWISSIWLPIIGILFFVNGFLGNTAAILISTVLVGFVFPSPQLFYWIVIPLVLGVITHFIWLGILINKANQ